MRVPLCPAVHGHIADSVRDHEPGRVVGSLWARKRKQAVHRTACSGISTIRPTYGRRDPTGSRENPVADIGGVALGWAELCRQAVCRFICATLRVLLGGRPRLLGRAWSAECNDRPRMNLGPPAGRGRRSSSASFR
jgi:hypothetical protein